MNLLARIGYEPRSIEIRRLVVIGIGLAVLSGLWYGARPQLTRTAAISSVGCYGRNYLIRAGLEVAGFDVPLAVGLDMHSLPRPGWVAWQSVLEYQDFPGGLRVPAQTQTTVVDGNFRLLGRLSGEFTDVPTDLDGDGNSELITWKYASRSSVDSLSRYYGVLRMRATGNELIWLGLFDDTPWNSRWIRVFPKWQDTDGDGIPELVFITVETARGPHGEMVFKTPEIIASFAFDRTTGILRTATMREDSGVTPWNPPMDGPLVVGQSEDLEPIFRRLLPLPDAAAATSQSQPAMSPAEDDDP